MNTKDLFKINTSSRRLNESLQKTFGKKINFETFSLDQLQDARNKLRTHLSQVRTNSRFNENLENDEYHKAQWMLDAINAEIAEREEYIVDDKNTSNNKLRKEKKMNHVNESEINQASTIVTAKTMVDRVGRWIEELSGMENDTLLQLGDSIRDEIGQEEAKQFISSVAPEIQKALEMLKQTRQTLANAVHTLAGEDTEMLGSDMGQDSDDASGMTDSDDDLDLDDLDLDMDSMASDEFDTADAAAGGSETAGRARRESIEFENNIYKTLAG